MLLQRVYWHCWNTAGYSCCYWRCCHQITYQNRHEFDNRLANSDSTIIKVLNRKHSEQVINIKNWRYCKTSKTKNFLEILNIVESSNTSDNTDKKTWVNLPKNTCRKNTRIYVNYSLCLYYRFLHGNVKEMLHEGIVNNFWISNGAIKTAYVPNCV